MADIRADAVAVYVYRKALSGLEFLQLKRSESTGEYAHSWQICYGGIQPGETAVQAARRELSEETGLVPIRMFQADTLESFYFRPRDYVMVMPVFAVEVAADAVPMLNNEHTGCRWIPARLASGAFMWRSQREAVRIIQEQLTDPTGGMQLMEIAL